jgi:hypothetical protein
VLPVQFMLAWCRVPSFLPTITSLHCVAAACCKLGPSIVIAMTGRAVLMHHTENASNNTLHALQERL